MARTKYNHRRRILDWQHGKIRALYPGMIAQFNYSGDNISDKSPLVLILWNDYKNYNIHGINLNYMTEHRIKGLVGKLIQGPVDFIQDDNILVEEDQHSQNDYDDNLPYRNLLTEPYTRLRLPTYREIRDGRQLSRSEAKKAMENLYNEVISKFMRHKERNIYRTYKTKKMSTIKVINYDIKGLLK